MLPESILNLFLSKNQRIKITILRMSIDTRINTDVISDLLLITKRSAGVLLDELCIEVNDILGNDSNFKLEKINKEYRFTPEFDNVKYIYVIKSLIKTYFVNASLYQALLFLLENRKTSIVEMANFLVYSQSYIYKLIDQIENLFIVLNLELKIKKSNNQIEIKGNESEIRLLHYFCILLVFNSLDWPFNFMSEKKVKQFQTLINHKYFKKLSPANQNKVNYIVGIYLEAISNKRKVENIPVEVVKLFEILSTIFDTRTTQNYFMNNFSLNEVEALNETIYLSFVSIYYTPELISQDEKIKLGKLLYEEVNENKLVGSARGLVDDLSELTELLGSEKYLLMWEICNRYTVIIIFKLWKFMGYQELIGFNTKKQQMLSSIIKQNFDHEVEYKALTYLENHLIQILLPYMLVTKNNSLNVYTEFYRKTVYKSVIERVLSSTYKSSVVCIVDDYHEADVVITDVVPIERIEGKDYFFFFDTTNEKMWHNLSIYIQRKITNKLR